MQRCSINILHRGRFSKFTTVVSQEFETECELVIKDLLENGRLTLKQITEGEYAVKDTVEKRFLKLVDARFVERCPAPEAVLEEASKDAPKKRGPKFSKVVEVPETIEQRVVAAAPPPSGAMRFSIMTDSETDAHGGSMSTGNKRKHDALELDEEFANNEMVLWRVNFEEFIRCLRHKVQLLPAHKRTGPLGKQWQRFRNVVYVMHATLLKIDDAVMLFHDF